MQPRSKPPACEGCPAYQWGVGFVPAEGPRDSQVLLLGQGPGEQEAYHSRPFVDVAPSGERLRRWVYKAGGQMTDCMVTNLVQCWLPEGRRNGHPWGNREPTAAEADFCWKAHVVPLINSMPNLRWIDTFGGPAAKKCLGIPWDKSVEKWVGSVVEREL